MPAPSTDPTPAPAAPLYRCRRCPDDAVALDDALMPDRAGTCVCARCWMRLTLNERELLPPLRTWLKLALAELDTDSL